MENLNDLSPVQWALRPFRKYFDASGRAPRAEYWWFALFYVVAYTVAAVVDLTLSLGDPIGSMGLLTAVVTFGFLLPQVMVGIRRLHDIGKSGWWILLSLVPLIGLFLLVLMATRGNEGLNDYGPDPYGAGELEEVFA